MKFQSISLFLFLVSFINLNSANVNPKVNLEKDIILALKNNEKDNFEKLIIISEEEKYNIINNPIDESFATLLHLATKKGLIEYCKILIHYGADVNAKNWINETPLHYAVDHEQEAICKLLLENGADINIKDSFGNTAFHLAEKKRNTRIYEILNANVKS